MPGLSIANSGAREIFPPEWQGKTGGKGMAREQQTFGFTESEEHKAKVEAGKSRDRKFGQASHFVKWFAERHREKTGRLVVPEDRQTAIKAAKIMLDNIGFADAGGRALIFLEICRRRKERAKISNFCLVRWRDIERLNAESDEERRADRIAHVNYLIQEDLREERSKVRPILDAGMSVNQTNQNHKERAKEYSLGELEYLAAQLLEQYGTPDAIPKGVKQRLDKGRQ